MVSTIKSHFLLKLYSQGRHFLLPHSDNKWLQEAAKTPTSPVTGSFKRMSISRTAQLDTPCSMLSRSCLKARACGRQPWLQGRSAGMKLSRLIHGVLGSLLGRAPEPQTCIPMPWQGPRSSVSAIRLNTAIHLTPTQSLTPPREKQGLTREDRSRGLQAEVRQARERRRPGGDSPLPHLLF